MSEQSQTPQNDSPPTPEVATDDGPPRTAAKTEPADLIASGPQVAGRLAVLTTMSMFAGIIPLPFVPSRVLRQLRGAVAHEVLAQHGISLVTDARTVLAEPNSADRMRTLLRRGVEVITRRLLRRLGPLSALSTVVSAFEVFALGHLLDRYVRRVRPSGTVRMYELEARRVRAVIDTTVLRMLSPAVKTRPLSGTGAVEDLRDEFTRWIDTLLVTTATVPSFLERRLDAAFDDVVTASPDIRDV